MRGYPKHINCKQDLLNLLEIKEYKEQAKTEIGKLNALDDSKATSVVSGTEVEGDLVTEEIDNPNPRWKQLGFATKKELSDLVTTEVAKDG